MILWRETTALINLLPILDVILLDFIKKKHFPAFKITYFICHASSILY